MDPSINNSLFPTLTNSCTDVDFSKKFKSMLMLYIDFNFQTNFSNIKENLFHCTISTDCPRNISFGMHNTFCFSDFSNNGYVCKYFERKIGFFEGITTKYLHWMLDYMYIYMYLIFNLFHINIIIGFHLVFELKI